MTDQPPVNQSPFDAYAPAQIAEKVETLGVTRAHLGALQTVLLGILAGAFISFGAMLFTLVVSDSVLGLGPTRLLGGLAFSLGLVLVVIAVDKVTLPTVELLFRGILCNTLVCLAVWLSLAAHTVSGKGVAIVFPITAFVALGFEHSVANIYLIPVGFLAS